MKSSLEGSAKLNRNHFLIWPILAAFVFFFASWKLDYPKPMWDDLFLNGAALNMAGGGDFSNPLLERQGFPSHYFFVHPPFHSYAVYWWLSVFGISAGSLLAFQNLMFFIIAAATIVVLWRNAARPSLLLLVPFAVAATFLKYGLRAEAIAVALTMSGYAVLIFCRKPGFLMWTGFFLLFIGTMTGERTAFFGAALALATSWRWLNRPPAEDFSRLKFCIVPVLALATAALLFLVLIHFQFAEFYHTFRFHTSRLEGGKLSLLVRFLRQSGMTWWPIFILTIFLLGTAVRRSAGEAGTLSFFLAVAFLVWGLLGGLSHGSTWCLVFIILMLAPALASGSPPSRARLLEFSIALVLLAANGTFLIELFGILSGNIQSRPPENRGAILALQSTKEHPILVDGAVARYVFDYRLPPGFIDYEFSVPFPGFVPTDAKIRPEDIFVLSPGKVSLLNDAIHTTYPIEHWSVFHSKTHSYFKYPRQAFVIPARDCVPFQEKLTAGGGVK